MPYSAPEIRGLKAMEAEYDFIVNPRARSGMGDMIWRMLEPSMRL